MKWRITYRGGWHKWFAWYPVKVGDHTRVWLEVVERKRICGKWLYSSN